MHSRVRLRLLTAYFAFNVRPPGGQAGRKEAWLSFELNEMWLIVRVFIRLKC